MENHSKSSFIYETLEAPKCNPRPKIISVSDYAAYHPLHRNGIRSSEYQLVVIKEGDGNVIIDGVECDFSYRSIIPICKDQVYSFKNLEGINGVVLTFSEDCLNRNSNDMQWLTELNVFNTDASERIIKLEEDDLVKLIAVIDGLENETSMESSDDSQEIIYNLLKMCLSLCNRGIKTGNGGGSKDERDKMLIVGFKQKLEKEFMKTRSVKYYADALNITPKKLNRASLKITGKHSSQIIEERVLLEAKRLLIHTNNVVKEIGYTLGFDDPSNFNKYFKKYSGYTPEGYRILNNGGI